MATATQNQTTDNAKEAEAPKAPEAPQTPAQDPAEGPAKQPEGDQHQDNADPKPSDKAQRKQGEALRKANGHKLEACLDEHGQVREDTDAYADLGFVYAATAPVANSWGAEVGVVTKDKESGTVQRTGFGFYFRSDHICNKKYDLSKIDLTKLP